MKNFDWAFTITLISVTPGGTSQSTGTYTAPGAAETTIKGHVIDLSIKELDRMPEGIYSIGDRRLICDKIYGVKPNDHIKITEADASETRWEVKEQEKSYGVMTKLTKENRASFLLKKKS